MSNNQTATKHKVPFGQKVAFGLGMLANQMFPAALGIFMVVLVQNLGFPTWMWGILFFLPRVFDSITDPIMGFISDNTKSVWGRRRHYVFIGAVIMGISFVLMWQLYKSDGISYNFIYFLLWSLVFYLGLTVFSVPYVAMGYEMSDDFHERTSIMAVAQWIGQWAWVIAPWFWVVMYDPSWFESADVATRTLAVWVGVICAVLAMIPAIFIKGKSTKNDSSLTPLSLKTIGSSLKEILKGFKEAFGYIEFRKLCFSTFLIFNAFNTVAGFSFFIVVYYLFNGDTASAGIWPTLLGSVGALSTTFIVIPIVAWMSKKMGKKNAFLLSQGISVIGYLMLWFLFIPGKPYMFLFALPFFSFGIGSLFTLMMSMTADVCDIDELATGKRREGIFGAIYWWMVKFGFAVAGLLTGAIMTLVGFVPDAVNSEASITGLRLFYSGLPMVGTLAAMFIMRNYDLTEERAHRITAELKKRKAFKPSGYANMKLLSEINVDTISANELKDKFPLLFSTKLDFSSLSKEDLQTEFTNVFQKGMSGICFSAYEKGQEPGDLITEEQIRKRLKVLKPHTQWIRVFSCTSGHEKIPKIAKEMGLKTMVGAWLDNDIEKNHLEIQALIKLIKEDLVDIAAVGNEVLYRGELSEQTIINSINLVKKASKNTPVGYVDAYYEFINRPQLVAACDIVLANCYPFWEGVDIRISGFYLQEMYHKTVEAAQGKKVIISETGWPSKGELTGSAEPSKENVMTYYIKTQLWAQNENVEVFYFSSFDESWKIHAEGWAGTSWGLWNSNEKFKY
ncbi:MAG: MFS transporter [Flavobacteriales bacterium]|nr:MFS transporter [Flavobacteriia bacterium]NCP06209.1 MFS transporter [Flavobacteriales bacterium]PIV93805.1 MAG: glycosyl hydrolase [Flavobacteriaceae bacterium CG17_big_fil_post_rev_8_21_14_2_50_33_15]PIY09972.1 MAG: glycosyl hydrolase [Flavobacteriaceae bacterium CG_4_10_14_3_um_filter_33_47]PJB19454.1 MAG: glycosyl hydrolase [Flavobacteriaceae bacterium CG_4_9_14_3_um_filter_33_16]